MGKPNKYEVERRKRAAKAKTRLANAAKFYGAVAKIERDIATLAETVRAPHRGEDDLRHVLHSDDQRHLSDAVASLRRVRDDRGRRR